MQEWRSLTELEMDYYSNKWVKNVTMVIVGGIKAICRQLSYHFSAYHLVSPLFVLQWQHGRWVCVKSRGGIKKEEVRIGGGMKS